VSAFVPLRVRSHGSLLHGTAAPEALVERAARLGCHRLALTDRDNLYVAIRFYRAAQARGIVPLLGAELTHGPRAILLLALDRLGYGHLCALLTARHLDPDFDPVAALGRRWQGLHVIVESTGLAASLLAAGVRAARGAMAARGSDGGGLWLGVRGLPGERLQLAERARGARWLGVPLVATGDCTLLAAAEHETHRVAVTAAAGELLARMPPGAFCAPEAWFAAPAEWERRVRALCASAAAPHLADEALANNAALAARCRLELELGRPIFPRAPVPAGETGPGYLLRLGLAGIERRYGAASSSAARDLRRRARARLEHELELIERLGFTGYFLLVADIVEFARARGIPTVGRGSGAGSIVAYCLGITNVDPLRYALYFERFLHPERRDCPDLDIDLCWKRRDEVIAHVYDTYGADRVAMISTQATLGARSAFRETAKALGVPNARVDALARHVPRSLEPPYLDRLRALPGARHVDWREPPLADALRLAERLDGAPRHLSIHSGGVVIGDRPLTHYVPLERAAKGIVVTQFEMHAIEAIGLVKMDLLGNRALTTIGECVALAERRHGVTLDVGHLPDPDPLASRPLAGGDTLNCFQLESPAMRHLLRMLEARTLDETIAAVALVRPGPAESGMKEAFCRRHRGLEPATFLHPRLEPVLRRTHGVLLYEEDVMSVAAALTGLPLAEGDLLRRAIAAAQYAEELAALEHGFVRRAAAAGVDEATARAVWRELTRFAAYSFCRAHAAGYGALAYQSVWLKTHFPTEYAVGVLNHHAGMYETWVHVEDLRRHGVRFLAPCVQRSDWDTTLEVVELGPPAKTGGSHRLSAEADGSLRPATADRLAPPPLRPASCWPPLKLRPRPPSLAQPRQASIRGGVTCPPASAAGEAAVRVGLNRVFGLSAATAARIVAERQRRRFASLADFLDRVRPTPPEVETLILAGALDVIGRSRPSLLLEARAHARLAPGRVRVAPVLAGPGGEVLPEAAPPLPVPELPEFDRAERVRGETSATGLWFSGHPLDTLAEAERGAITAAALPDRAGRRARVLGLPCAWRRVETRGGEPMMFVSLADRSGIAECVLFPDVYRALAPALGGRVLEAEGRVGETLGSVSLTVERMRPLA
jgi:DNA polymerase III subunit alpha